MSSDEQQATEYPPPTHVYARERLYKIGDGVKGRPLPASVNLADECLSLIDPNTSSKHSSLSGDRQGFLDRGDPEGVSLKPSWASPKYFKAGEGVRPPAGPIRTKLLADPEEAYDNPPRVPDRNVPGPGRNLAWAKGPAPEEPQRPLRVNGASFERPREYEAGRGGYGDPRPLPELGGRAPLGLPGPRGRWDNDKEIGNWRAGAGGGGGGGGEDDRWRGGGGGHYDERDRGRDRDMSGDGDERRGHYVNHHAPPPRHERWERHQEHEPEARRWSDNRASRASSLPVDEAEWLVDDSPGTRPYRGEREASRPQPKMTAADMERERLAFRAHANATKETGTGRLNWLDEDPYRQQEIDLDQLREEEHEAEDHGRQLDRQLSAPAPSNSQPPQAQGFKVTFEQLTRGAPTSGMKPLPGVPPPAPAGAPTGGAGQAPATHSGMALEELEMRMAAKAIATGPAAAPSKPVMPPPGFGGPAVAPPPGFGARPPAPAAMALPAGLPPATAAAAPHPAGPPGAPAAAPPAGNAAAGKALLGLLKKGSDHSATAQPPPAAPASAVAPQPPTAAPPAPPAPPLSGPTVVAPPPVPAATAAPPAPPAAAPLLPPPSTAAPPPAPAVPAAAPEAATPTSTPANGPAGPAGVPPERLAAAVDPIVSPSTVNAKPPGNKVAGIPTLPTTGSAAIPESIRNAFLGAFPGGGLKEPGGGGFGSIWATPQLFTQPAPAAKDMGLENPPAGRPPGAGPLAGSTQAPPGLGAGLPAVAPPPAGPAATSMAGGYGQGQLQQQQPQQQQGVNFKNLPENHPLHALFAKTAAAGAAAASQQQRPAVPLANQQQPAGANASPSAGMDQNLTALLSQLSRAQQQQQGMGMAGQGQAQRPNQPPAGPPPGGQYPWNQPLPGGQQPQLLLQQQLQQLQQHQAGHAAAAAQGAPQGMMGPSQQQPQQPGLQAGQSLFQHLLMQQQQQQRQAAAQKGLQEQMGALPPGLSGAAAGAAGMRPQAGGAAANPLAMLLQQQALQHQQQQQQQALHQHHQQQQAMQQHQQQQAMQQQRDAALQQAQRAGANMQAMQQLMQQAYQQQQQQQRPSGMNPMAMLNPALAAAAAARPNMADNNLNRFFNAAAMQQAAMPGLPAGNQLTHAELERLLQLQQQQHR